MKVKVPLVLNILRAQNQNLDQVQRKNYFHILLKDYQKKKLDLIEELKVHLNEINIKFKEGDWQSF